MNREHEIKAFAKKFTLEKKSELELWKVHEDLAALYEDIQHALTEQDVQYESLMAEYENMMLKEQAMYDPFEAYKAGITFQGVEHETAFWNYLTRLIGNSDNQKILSERDRLFYLMCDILQEDERRMLLKDYNEIFRQYHGIISNNIQAFFDEGYFEKNEANVNQ